MTFNPSQFTLRGRTFVIHVVELFANWLCFFNIWNSHYATKRSSYWSRGQNIKRDYICLISKLISNSLCSYCLSKISENNSNPFFGFQFRGIETKIDHNFLLIFVHKFSLQTWLCKVVIKSFCLIVIFEFDNSDLRLSWFPKHFNRHDNIRVIPAIRTANYFL